MKPTTKLLFVCLGNICRSPAAEGVMRRLVEREGLAGRIECDSAGTYGGHAGELPDHRMRRAASARGYDLNHHRARQVRTEDFDRFDMILTMDDSNYERVHRLAPSATAAQKIFRRFLPPRPGRSASRRKPRSRPLLRGRRRVREGARSVGRRLRRFARVDQG